VCNSGSFPGGKAARA